MPQAKTLTPGCTIIYPNREKPTNKTTKSIVALILLISVGLMLLLTIGGWSKLAGMKVANFVWCIAYVLIAYYVTRWRRGMLPIAATLALLLFMTAVVAGLGANGASWFDRNQLGFAAPHTIFGGKGLGPDLLGLITLLIAPVQLLLIFFSMMGFSQGWQVEVEVPVEEARRRGYNPPASPPGEPATA